MSATAEYEARGRFIILGNHAVARIEGQENEAWSDARALVRVLNAHDPLVAALRAMIAAGEYHYAQSGWPSQFHAGALDAARAAIAKAKGEA